MISSLYNLCENPFYDNELSVNLLTAYLLILDDYHINLENKIRNRFNDIKLDDNGIIRLKQYFKLNNNKNIVLKLVDLYVFII